MKRPSLILLLMLGWASATEAAITVGVAGPGALTDIFEDTVSFPQNPSTGEGTITEWSITGSAPVIKTVTYGQGDLDFTDAGSLGSGFRWAEIVTNDSGVAWIGFQITFTPVSASSTLGQFLNTPIGGNEVPGFADINQAVSPPTIDVLSDLGVPTAEGWIMNLSADQRVITMDFSANPIDPSESFEIHIPIERLANASGSFTLTEQARFAPVPEPSTLCVWATLGLVACGYRKRRMNAK